VSAVLGERLTRIWETPETHPWKLQGEPLGLGDARPGA